MAAETFPVFIDLEAFGRALMERSPSVALVTWRKLSALRSFIDHVGLVLRKHRADTLVSKIHVAKLDRQAFSEQILKTLKRRDAARICLLIYEIEPLASSVGRILNGYRERIASLRALVLCIRENRLRDLLLECPDLVDWIGSMVGRAEDLGSPLTLPRVRKAIRSFERRHGLKSKEFVKQLKAGGGHDLADAWVWEELLAVKCELEKAHRP